MITVDYVDSPPEPDSQGQVRFVCKAWHSQGQHCVFNAYASFSDTPDQMNTAIKEAAVLACAYEGITVAPGDKKTLFGGVINI